MKHPRAARRKTLCAVVLACYGILSLAATAPHAHYLDDFRSAGPVVARSAGQGPALACRPDTGSTPGNGGRASQCRLCAWGRSVARPAAAAHLGESEPPLPTIRRVIDGIQLEAPLASTALLRAPPLA